MDADSQIDEPKLGDGRKLSLGWPEPFDSMGIDRRLSLLEEVRPFSGGAVLYVGCGQPVQVAEHPADTGACAAWSPTPEPTHASCPPSERPVC